jgi:hypothetical protein
VDYNPFEKSSARKPMASPLSAIVGAGQGVSGNLSDELIAGLTAFGVSAAKPFMRLAGYSEEELPNDVYNTKLQELRQVNQQAATDNPLSYTAGAMTGAVAGAGKLTAPLAATKIGSKIAGATLPTAVGRLVTGTAKVAAPAAVSGYIAGFGSGEGGLDNRMAQAKDDALLSAALGVAAKPVVGAIKGIGEVGKGAFARGNKQLASASSAMKNATNQSYADMRKYNVALNQNGVKKVGDNIIAGLQNELIDTDLNKNFVTMMKGFSNQVSKGTDIEHLDKWRRKFYSMADGLKSTDPIVKDNARLANIVAKKLDDALYNQLDDNLDFVANSTNALEALKKGRANSMQQRKFEIVSDIVKKSKGDANYVKRELAKISDANTKKGENQLRFFTPDEAAELAKVADLGVGEAALKIAGKFGFDSSRLGRGVGAAVGAGAGGAAAGLGGAIAVPIVGTAASMAQKGLVQGRADKLLQTIERGGQSLPTSAGLSISPAIGAAVSAQPDNQGKAQAPSYNLEPVDFNPFEQLSPNNPQNAPIPREPLTLEITPQSYNTQMQIPDTRGFRNNNPANLRGDDEWIGKTGVDDAGFVQFDTPQAGLRAMAINLNNQQKKYGIDTVAGLISKYAPSNENDTMGYIQKVSNDLGVKPNQKIQLNNDKVMLGLMKSMITMENGVQPYQESQLIQAVNQNKAYNNARIFYKKFDNLSQTQQSALISMSESLPFSKLKQFTFIPKGLQIKDKNARLKMLRDNMEKTLLYKQTPDRAKKIVTMLAGLE